MSFYYKKFLLKNFSKYSSQENPKVFFEISKDGKNLGKMVFELFENHNPKTSKNFLYLCKGYNNLHYKKNHFHRIINGFMAQGGDITRGNGTGGMSIYGPNFPDENMKVKHIQRGMLSMANAGKNTNSSQFFITFAPCEWLDGNHCVFGEMTEGEDILKQIEASGTRSGQPTSKIVIEDCGEVVNNKV